MILFGVGVAVFAVANTLNTTVNLFGIQIINAPLYSVVIGSMLIGIIAAAIIGLFNSIGSAFTIFGKERKIKEVAHNNDSLKEEIARLKLENEKLKTINKEEIIDKPSFAENLRQNFK